MTGRREHPLVAHHRAIGWALFASMYPVWAGVTWLAWTLGWHPAGPGAVIVCMVVGGVAAVGYLLAAILVFDRIFMRLLWRDE